MKLHCTTFSEATINWIYLNCTYNIDKLQCRGCSAAGNATVTVELEGETADYTISVTEVEEEPEMVNVTLDANGVSGVKTQTYTIEVGEWKFPVAPNVEGKVFKGYSSSPSGASALGDSVSTISTADVPGLLAAGFLLLLPPPLELGLLGLLG